MLHPIRTTAFSAIASFVLFLFAGTSVHEATAAELSDYILFARDSLIVRDRPHISGSCMGANGYTEIGIDAVINGNLRCRHNARLLDRARVEGNVTTGGTLTLCSGATVTGTIIQNAAVDSIPIPAKSFSYGSADVTVGAGQTKSLAPGSYRNFHAYANSRITFSAGVYNFRKLLFEPEVRLTISVPCDSAVINVAEQISFGDRNTVVISGSQLPSRAAFYSNQSSTLNIGTDGNYTFVLTAPYSRVSIGSRTTLTGRVAAKKITLEPDVTTLPPLSVTITSPREGTITNRNPIDVTWEINGVVQTVQTTQTLTEGPNTIRRTCIDPYGRTASDSVHVTLDTHPPVVVISAPANGLTTNQPNHTIRWTVDGTAYTKDTVLSEGLNTITRSITDTAGNTGSASVTVTLDTQLPVVVITAPSNGSITNQANQTIRWTVDGTEYTSDTVLSEGANTISRSVVDAAGNTGSASVAVTLDTQPPVVFITAPANGSITNQANLTIRWTVDGTEYTSDTILSEGANTISRSAVDAAGNTGSASVAVTLDTQPLVVVITAPANGSITNQANQTIRWTVDGTEYTSDTVLSEGPNTITRSATDPAGNTGSASITVTLDTHAPVVTITAPANGLLTNQPNQTIRWTVDGTEHSSDTVLSEGANTISRSAVDAAGNTATASVSVTLDIQAPIVVIESPANGFRTNNPLIHITWTVDGLSYQQDTTLSIGDHTIIKSAIDSAGNTGIDSVAVTIINENRDPYFEQLSDVLIMAGRSSEATLRANDPDNDSLSFTLQGLPSFGSYVDNADNTCSLHLTPQQNDTGVFVVRVAVSDGARTVTDSFTVAVIPSISWAYHSFSLLNVAIPESSATNGAIGPAVSVFNNTPPLYNESYSRPVLGLNVWGADLTVAAILPSLIFSDTGHGIRGTIKVIIENTGSERIYSRFKVPVFIDMDSDNRFDPRTDILVYMGESSENLLRKKYDTVVCPVGYSSLFLGADLREGISVYIDHENVVTELDENNNHGQRLLNRFSAVDLQGISVDARRTHFDPVTAVVSGYSDVKIKNTGSESIVTGYAVCLFEDADFDGKYDPSKDNYLGGTRHTGPHLAGETVDMPVWTSGKLAFPGSLINAFIDSGNAVFESDEGNNIASSASECADPPDSAVFHPVLKWKWDSSTIAPASKNVLSSPMVIDLNGDATPDVVFISSSSQYAEYSAPGVLRAIDGRNGKELFSFDAGNDSAHLLNAGSFIAAGDIDNDGKPEIVAQNYLTNRLIAFSDGGVIQWVSDSVAMHFMGAPAIGDLDADGKPEIAMGSVIFNNRGAIIRNLPGPPHYNGIRQSSPLTVIADLNGDDMQEVIAGQVVYDSYGNLLWHGAHPDGYAAVADINHDGYPEIIASAPYWWETQCYDRNGTMLWSIEVPCKASGPGGGINSAKSGPPVVADFNGDGDLEIGVSCYTCYTVFSKDGDVLWSKPIKDYTSGFTAAAAFDFDGDGKSEIVYRDEDSLRIFRGTDGHTLFRYPISSSTGFESPIVADVDNDGKAEIVVSANTMCGIGPQFGVYCFGDTADTWVNTRKIWNQHAYCINNVNDDGTIPEVPKRSWREHNTFRCNSSRNALACKDLSASNMEIAADTTGVSSAALTVRVGNSSIVSVPESLSVAFFNGDPRAVANVLRTVKTPKRLNPGEYCDIRITVPADSITNDTVYASVDNDGAGRGEYRESDEDNNTVYVIRTQSNVNDPRIISLPRCVAYVDSPYTYPVLAVDPRGEPLRYSLPVAPAGMTIGETSGQIAWTPRPSDTGVHEVGIAVVNESGRGTRQSYLLRTTGGPLNAAPVLSAIPPLKVIAGNTLTVAFEYFDRDGDQVNLTLEPPLPFVTLTDSGNGKASLRIQPGEVDLGRYSLSIIASDSKEMARTRFPLDVERYGNRHPVITSAAVNTATVGNVYEYQVVAVDEDSDPITYTLAASPSGMEIDSITGRITWTPASGQAGIRSVKVYASDGWISGCQEFSIVVKDTANRAPVISSVPPVTGCIGAVYTYQIQAADADNDPLSYSLESAPEGMAISNAGCIFWPDSGNRPANSVVVARVTDNKGASAMQSWSIGLIPDNLAPLVAIGFSANPVRPGRNVIISVIATDNAGVVERRLLIDGSQVPLDENGEYTMTATGVDTVRMAAFARDAAANEGTANSRLVISDDADDAPPTVTLTATPAQAQVGDNVFFTVAATDDMALDYERVWLKVDGRYVTLNGSGQATCKALKTGTLHAIATAYDQSGNYGEAAVAVPVTISGSDAVPPVAEITSPAADTTILGLAAVIGTAVDDNFAFYTLSYADVTNQNFVEYHRGLAPVSSGVLGTFNATTLENGDYTIRLTAYDQYGNWSVADVTVHVVGQAKIGNFTLSFADLTTVANGLNLEVTRSYDSRNKAKGDFGIGWRVGVKSIKLSELHPAGDGWRIYDAGGTTYSGGGMSVYIPNYQSEERKKHTVSIAIPGARTQEFDVELHFNSQFDNTTGTISYKPRAGTYSKLECLDDVNFFRSGDNLYTYAMTGYLDPNRYKLTLLDGSYYIFDQNQGGIVEMSDANGNKVTINSSGIGHSDGDTVKFVRDAQNRITTIQSTDGRALTYTYDGHGNLATVTDPNGNITRFKYGPNSYLMEIIDPRGIRAARTEYDDEGRMVRQINANGDTLAYNHDLATRKEIVKNFAGNETQFTYDDRGNVLTKTDSRNNTWSYTYDSLDNQLSETYPGGAGKSATYDSSGNKLTETDERHHTTRWTYNAKGKMTSKTDALNRVTTYTYDATGNLLREIGPDGAIVSGKGYDPYGNVIADTNALGEVTRHTYSGGRITETRNPLGRFTRWTYNAAGNVLSETDAKGFVTRFTYDANGNKLTETDALGHTAHYEYTSFNKVNRETDTRGTVTRYEYDAFGQLIRTIAPDTSETRQEYDQSGNLAKTIDPAGRVVRMEYDPDNRLTKTTFNDSSFTTIEYDARGRRTATVEANGNRTVYEYDAAGNNTLVRDALGNVTRYEYDEVNRKTAMVDALGHHTEYQYDDYDRLVKTIFHDGTFKTTTYNAAGRKIAETDQEGKTTSFAYDAAGNLTSVTDALTHATSYTYDANNNRITQTDANTHTTAMAYDSLNRLILKTYPNGDNEHYGYDSTGNMVFKVDGNGDSTVHTYDSRSREISRRYTISGHTVRTVYTIDGRPDTVTDYRGATAYLYDSRGRQARVTNPDGSFIESRYDRQGNRTVQKTPYDTTLYRYDILNPMDSVIAINGAVTEYFYDAVGNRDSLHNANGTATKYRYDNLNRLTNVTNHGPSGSVISSYTYTLNAAGIRTGVSEADGSQVTYGYDDLYRLTGETRTGTSAYAISYTYDNVGNRLTQVRDGQTTTYTYNNRDQLTDEAGPNGSIAYTYDAAGRQTCKTDASGTTTYAWTDNDRMVSVSGPSVSSIYTYDAEGRRVSETSAGETKNYLIDAQLPYGQVIAETDDSGNLGASHVYGQDRISMTRGSATHFYLADGQGSVRQLADVAGVATDSWTYSAFGEIISRTGPTPNTFTYTGEQWDPNCHFYYLRARLYNPTTGTFTSVDPYEGDPQTPVSLHSYLYANANPNYYCDPNGKLSLVDAMIAGALVGAIVYTTIYGINTPADEFNYGDQLSAGVEGAFWGSFTAMNAYAAAAALAVAANNFNQYCQYATARDIGRMADLVKIRGVRPVTNIIEPEEAVWVKAFRDACSKKIYFRIRSELKPENLWDPEGNLTGFGKELSEAGYKLEKRGNYWYFLPR